MSPSDDRPRKSKLGFSIEISLYRESIKPNSVVILCQWFLSFSFKQSIRDFSQNLSDDLLRNIFIDITIALI